MAYKRPGQVWHRLLSAIGMAAALTAGICNVKADDSTSALNIIADQVRVQGFLCTTPKSAEHDLDASKPGEEAWMLTCDDDVYRVILVPDQAAHIEKLE